MNLTCPRCGIVHHIKAKAYEKRIDRNNANATACRDCYTRPEQTNFDDFWLYVKTTLRLNAN